MAFNPQSRRYFELHKLEADALTSSNGNISKLIESRVQRFGCIEPTLEQFEQMRIQKNLSKLRGGQQSSNEQLDSVEESKRILDKLRLVREKIGQEHLRIMHRDREEVLSKTKTELLELYAM